MELNFDNSEMDTAMLQKDEHHKEVSDLLNTIIVQNDKNNPEPILETLVQQNEVIKDKVENAGISIAQAIEKSSEDMKKIVSTLQVVNEFLPKVGYLKGDQGEKGEKGDRGDKGEPGKDGESGKTPIPGVDFVLPKDGKDAVVDYELIIDTVVKIIPPPKDGKAGKDGSPDTGKDIVKKLEELEGKDRLSYDALKNAPDFALLQRLVSSRDYDFLELKDVPSSYSGQGGKIVSVKTDGTGLEFVTSSSTYTIVENEHPPESADGSRVNFTFLHTPITNSEKVFVGPGRMTVAGGDYTLTGITITFTTPPPTDAVITFDYRY